MKGMIKKNPLITRMSGKDSLKGRRTFRNRVKKWLVFLLLLFITVTGIIAVRMFQRAVVTAFSLREIMIQGNSHLTEGEVTSLAGLRRSEGLLRISGKSITENLLKSPWIKDATVRKDLPDMLRIKIYESAPFAILELKKQAFFIDDRGRMLDKMKGESVPFLPIISGDPSRKRAIFLEALTLAKVLKSRNMAKERGRVEIVANGEGPEDLSIVVDGILIKIGNGEYSKKLDRFAAIEEEIKKRALAIDYIDVRFNDKVVIKPITGVVR